MAGGNEAFASVGAGVMPGFSDSARASQQIFRDVMRAMAEPGRPVATPGWPLRSAPGALLPSAAAIALTLADFETALFLDARLAAEPEVLAFLDFHTGAPRTADPAQAQFALIADPSALGDLGAFAQGSAEYPDRSTTLILQVDAFDDAHAFAGPGIKERIGFGFSPEPPDFATQWRANRGRFPRGVDLILAGHDAIAALPRSSRLMED